MHEAPVLDRCLPLPQADPVSEIFRLLTDPTRAGFLRALSLADELCLCDIGLLATEDHSEVCRQLRLGLADEHIRRMLANELRRAAMSRSLTGTP
jgi:DNA-binding transcriptional ArsR family regulator